MGCGKSRLRLVMPLRELGGRDAWWGGSLIQGERKSGIGALEDLRRRLPRGAIPVPVVWGPE